MSQTRHTLFSNCLIKSPNFLQINYAPLQFFPKAFSTPCSLKTLSHMYSLPEYLHPLHSYPFCLPHLLYWSLEKSFFALHLEKVFYLPITKSKPAPTSPILGKKQGLSTNPWGGGSLSLCARRKILLWILLGKKPIFLAKPLEEGSYLHHPLVTFLLSSWTSLQKWILC